MGPVRLPDDSALYFTTLPRSWARLAARAYQAALGPRPGDRRSSAARLSLDPPIGGGVREISLGETSTAGRTGSILP